MIQRTFIDEDSASEVAEMLAKKSDQDARIEKRQRRQNEIDSILNQHFADYRVVPGFLGDIKYEPKQRLAESVTVKYANDRKYALLFLRFNPDSNDSTAMFLARKS